MDILVRILCMLIGYGFGCISVSYIYGKARGIDVREHGSGNAGTTNTLRVMGRKAGAIVLAGDMLKTWIAILVSWLIFHWFFPDMDYLLKIYTAAGAILGHDYPFYMKFKGGKGIACSGAMILSFYWGIIPGEVVIFFGIFFLTHYVSLASIFMYIGFLVQLVLFGQTGFLGMTQPALIELYIVVAFLTALALYQHRQNIVRLVKGEEKAIYLKKTKKDMDDISLDENPNDGTKTHEIVADVVEAMKDKTEEMAEEVKETVEEAVGEIKETVEEVVEEIKEKAEDSKED